MNSQWRSKPNAKLSLDPTAHRVPSIGSVLELRFARMLGAMSATVNGSIRFQTMADNAATAVAALRGQAVDGAFEAVESVALASNDDFEGFVINISASFTGSRHIISFGW